MRAIPRPRLTPSHAARPRPALWLATKVLLVALTTGLVVVLLGLLPESWTTWGTLPPQAVGLALLVGGLAVLLTRGLSQAQRREQGGRLRPDEPAAVDTEGAGDEEEPPPDPADLRMLRAHVRSLEQALELESRRVAELRALLDGGHPRGDDGLQQVRATIRGLARRTAGDAVAAEVLERLEAGLQRLSAPPAFARPVLTRAPTAIPGSAPSPGEVLMHESHPAPRGAPGSADAHGAEGPGSTGSAEDPGPHPLTGVHPASGTPEREVVLPVPPREHAEAGSRHRGRRWLGRRAPETHAGRAGR